MFTHEVCKRCDSAKLGFEFSPERCQRCLAAVRQDFPLDVEDGVDLRPRGRLLRVVW